MGNLVAQSTFLGRWLALTKSMIGGGFSSHGVVSTRKFGGNKIQNHILYPTSLIALEMSYKEGATVDIVFHLPSICVPDLEKSKNIIFFPWGCENI